MKLGYMGTDQYGNTFHLTDAKYPRKQLLDKFGGTTARKMYVDTKAGEAKHIGYIIGTHWVKLYEVHEFIGNGK